MAKKEMKMMEEKCSMCETNPCKCDSGCYGHCSNRWCKAVAGLIVVVLGLLIIWPQGWFTPWHTVGLLVALAGLRKFFHCCVKCK